MFIEVHGIYAFEAEEPVHLVEMQIHDFNGEVDLNQITQPIPSDPHCCPQVPWLPYMLDSTGISGDEISQFDPIGVQGNLRFAFFLHYLNTTTPLQTQFGPIPLPKETAKPERLNFIEYQPVD